MTNHAYEWDLLERGREQGRTEGLALGKAEGIAQGKAEGIAQGRTEWIAQGKAEGIAQGRTEGIAQGKAEGEERYGKLIRALISDGKEGLILKTADDPELRESLYKQYGIQ